MIYFGDYKECVDFAKNPCEFPEGSTIRSVYTNRVYIITKHYKNGMCNLFQPSLRCNENWNACNNRHFVLVEDNVSLGVISLIYAEQKI
jgi:hypothetical protein